MDVHYWVLYTPLSTEESNYKDETGLDSDLDSDPLSTYLAAPVNPSEDL